MVSSTPDIPKYPYIDALRGYAILGVLLVHASQAISPSSPILQRLMFGGSYGVQLFYVVSAITLCMSWHVRSPQEDAPVRNFLLRRWFRIAPMFYLAVALYVFIYGFSPSPRTPNGVEWWFIPLTLLFLHGLHPETILSVVPGGWSIAVEMSFYLVLPILLRRLTSTSSSLAFLLTCLAASALSSLAFAHLWSGAYPAHQQWLVTSFLYCNFFNQLPIFALGILAYRVIENRRHLLLWMIGGTVLLLPLILLLLVHLTSPLAHAVPSHIVMGALFAILALALAHFPVRALVNPPIIQLGKISFSIYLLHPCVIEVCTRLGFVDLFPKGDVPSVLFFLFIVAVTVLLSYITYMLVERPGVRLGNRLIAHLELESSQHVPHTVRSFPTRL